MLYCTIIARRHSLRRGGAKTAGCVMTDRLDWRVAIIGFDRMQRVRYFDAYAQQSGEPEPSMDDGRRKTHLVQYIDDEDDLRRSFYQALLEIKWLPSKNPKRRHVGARSFPAGTSSRARTRARGAYHNRKRRQRLPRKLSATCSERRRGAMARSILQLAGFWICRHERTPLRYSASPPIRSPPARAPWRALLAPASRAFRATSACGRLILR